MQIDTRGHKIRYGLRANLSKRKVAQPLSTMATTQSSSQLNHVPFPLFLAGQQCCHIAGPLTFRSSIFPCYVPCLCDKRKDLIEATRAQAFFWLVVARSSWVHGAATFFLFPALYPSPFHFWVSSAKHHLVLLMTSLMIGFGLNGCGALGYIDRDRRISQEEEAPPRTASALPSQVCLNRNPFSRAPPHPTTPPHR